MADLPRAVHFVAETPVLDRMWFSDAMFAAEVAPLGAFFHVAIFDKSCGLFRGAGAEIESHERFRAGEFAPGHEFVGAELIGLDGVPGFFQLTRAIFLGADAVEPVIARDKVAAGIANHGHAEMLDFIGDIGAEAVRIGKLGARIVNTFVDGAAEVFEKRAEDVAIERRHGAARIEKGTSGGAGRGLSEERFSEHKSCGAARGCGVLQKAPSGNVWHVKNLR